MFCEKGVLRKVIKKEILAQVFSCEFCEISKNTFFHRTPLVAASGYNLFSEVLVYKFIQYFSVMCTEKFTDVNFQLICCMVDETKISYNSEILDLLCCFLLYNLSLNTYFFRPWLQCSLEFSNIPLVKEVGVTFFQSILQFS